MPLCDGQVGAAMRRTHEHSLYSQVLETEGRGQGRTGKHPGAGRRGFIPLFGISKEKAVQGRATGSGQQNLDNLRALSQPVIPPFPALG